MIQRGEIDIVIVIVGADRVAANGDVCNKIGTCGKALAAHDNRVPLYGALPSPTPDPALACGDAIPIEARSPDEVLVTAGRISYGHATAIAIAPAGTPAINYVFDVTPARLIRGLITEGGIAQADRGATV